MIKIQIKSEWYAELSLRLSLGLRNVALVSAALAGTACSGPSLGFLSNNNGIINNQSKFSVSAYGVAASPRLTSSRNVTKGGGRYMVGSPYRVAGRWYHPKENNTYNQTGTASWYGPNFHGRMTANGETFDQFHLSAAHPTLPLPSYVRVQNLTNGRSVVVRVNDRGPFAHNRLIDVSRRTAEVLGFIDSGTAHVRVTYVGRAPVEGDDTRFLVASINAPEGANIPSPTSVQTSPRQPGIFSRQNGGVLGAFTSLFSYSGAMHGQTLVTGAHAAVNEMAENVSELETWKTRVEGAKLRQPLNLGTFSDETIAMDIAQKFAFLGAVRIQQITSENNDATQLLMTTLKPGVQLNDIRALGTNLGLNWPSH